MLTAEQRMRYALTGDPNVDPNFQHEGEEIVRWITGGTQPDLHVRLHHDGNMIVVRCAVCGAELGTFPANYSGDTSARIGAMRTAEHEHKVLNTSTF